MSNFLYGGNVHANGIRQHYLRYGGGARRGRDPVIIVPGITSPAITWGFVGERFGESFDTYILDVRGRGLSEAGAALNYGLVAQAADVLAFAQALGLEQYSLVGHSMGGRIGVRAGRSKPAGLRRLVLADLPVSGPGRRPYPAKLPWYVDSMAQARQGMDAEAMRAFCPSWTDAQRQLRAEWLHTCDERAIIQSFDDFHNDDIHADLPLLDAAVLLITAERGDVVLDADVEEIQRLAPGTRHHSGARRRPHDSVGQRGRLTRPSATSWARWRAPETQIVKEGIMPISDYEMVKAWQQVLTLSRLQAGQTVTVLTSAATHPQTLATALIATQAMGAVVNRLDLPPVNGERALSRDALAYLGTTPLTGNKAAIAALKESDLVLDLMTLLFSPEQHEILASGTKILLAVEPPEVLARLVPTEADRAGSRRPPRASAPRAR